MLRCEIDTRGMNYAKVYALQVNEGMVLCKCLMARIISILPLCVQIEQECIPVGCVPSAAVAVGGGVFVGGGRCLL